MHFPPQMAAKYLRHQFSIPHHLVPSFEDTAGVLAHEAADDTVNDDDDPLVPGAPVSPLRSNHAERDRSVVRVFLHKHQISDFLGSSRVIKAMRVIVGN